MGGYALYLVGIVFIGYGIYLAKKPKVFVPQNYETIAILVLLVMSQITSSSFLELALIIGIFGIVTMAMSNKNYILYHTSFSQVETIIKDILDEKNIPYEVRRGQIILNSGDGIIRLRGNGKVVTVIMAKARAFHDGIKEGLEKKYLASEPVYSKTGIILAVIGVGAILIGIFLR